MIIGHKYFTLLIDGFFVSADLPTNRMKLYSIWFERVKLYSSHIGK